jgi:phosphoribosylformimino-5-aminoimidazole carboxamide ribotide isomerase
MQVWPAIDLLNGNCVRLRQGDYAQDTVFSDDPGAMASKWFDEGADCLHCVDLDGAKSGSIVNESAIRAIIDAANGKAVQLGGGVRSEETIERLLELGLRRLVVGTAALKDPEWFGLMCRKYPGSLVLGLDARDGFVATQGWLNTSKTLATELVKQIAEHTTECVAVVYTDIARDGMMAGPNLEALAAMQAASPFPVSASGGITTIADVDALVAQNTAECIIGRTLYEGKMSLKQALIHAAKKQ